MIVKDIKKFVKGLIYEFVYYRSYDRFLTDIYDKVTIKLTKRFHYKNLLKEYKMMNRHHKYPKNTYMNVYNDYSLEYRKKLC